MSERTAGKPDCTVLDGCAILCEAFKQYLDRMLKSGAVYLVLDRYIGYSIKSPTRKSRGPDGCRLVQLSMNCPLPPQGQVLNIAETSNS